MNQPLGRTHLFLRTDGSVMLAKGDVAVEALLTPQQLITFAIDAMRTAVALDPHLLEAACEALETTYVLPAETAPCATHLN